MNVEDIAKICHGANRAYCQVMGDDSQPEWEDAPEWQKQSAIAGVMAYLANPAITPEEMHEGWMLIKENDGWKYGERKDAEKKEHPCMVPYSELPPEQKIKDSLFSGVVKSIINFEG